jgi:hypothetical protein
MIKNKNKNNKKNSTKFIKKKKKKERQLDSNLGKRTLEKFTTSS